MRRLAEITEISTRRHGDAETHGEELYDNFKAA
jgi:hypothetical protein